MLRELCITEHSGELTYVRELLAHEISVMNLELDLNDRWCRVTNLHTQGESIQPCADWQWKIDNSLLHPLKLGAVVEALNAHGDVVKR